jgi:hypothetical protein
MFSSISYILYPLSAMPYCSFLFYLSVLLSFHYLFSFHYLLYTIPDPPSSFPFHILNSLYISYLLFYIFYRQLHYQSAISNLPFPILYLLYNYITYLYKLSDILCPIISISYPLSRIPYSMNLSSMRYHFYFIFYLLYPIYLSYRQSRIVSQQTILNSSYLIPHPHLLSFMSISLYHILLFHDHNLLHDLP